MVCCIEAGETPLSKGNRRFGEPSIAGRVVLQLVDKIFRWGSQTLCASLPGGIVAFSTKIPDLRTRAIISVYERTTILIGEKQR